VDRRNFLQKAGVGLAAVSFPGWLQACSRGVGTGVDGPLEGDPKSGAEALALAKRNGRPLLVFVVPENTMQRWVRGRVLGVYINRANADGMSDLVMCGVWCATPTEIRSGLAREVDVDDATLAVLIETDDGTSTRVAGDPILEEPINGHASRPEEAIEQSESRTELVSKRLHDAIAPDEATVHRRAHLARTTFLPRANRFGLGPMREGDEPNQSQVERVPAWVRWRAEESDEAERAKWIAMLSDEAVRKWRTGRIPRAHWASSIGCGTEFEDKSNLWGSQVQCGMAFIPEYSSRFLSFYSEDE
jgi:hypothetical protein